MKRTVSFLLGLSLLSTLAACSAGNDSAGTPNAVLPSENSTPQQSASNLEEVEGKTISIEAYSWDYDTNEDVLETCEGEYTGETLNGMPDGYGRFDSENDSGQTWYYEGYFKNGRFHGQGGAYWSDGYSEVGTYVDGAYRPTYPEILEYYSKYDNVTYNMNSTSKTFIEEHTELFPAATDQAVAEVETLIDPSIGYPQIEKNLSSVQGKLCLRENVYVAQASEVNERGTIITTLFVTDKDGDHFYIHYNGSLPDIYADMYIDFVGLPIAVTSFDNISGGITNTAVIAANSICLADSN